MLHRWIARLVELDGLLTEAERSRAMYELFKLSPGADAHRVKYEQCLLAFNARRFWWMRPRRPNAKVAGLGRNRSSDER